MSHTIHAYRNESGYKRLEKVLNGYPQFFIDDFYLSHATNHSSVWEIQETLLGSLPNSLQGKALEAIDDEFHE